MRYETVTSSEDAVVFVEHRQWQIASDAVPNSPTNFEDTPSFDNIVATTTTPVLGEFAATDDDGDWPAALDQRSDRGRHSFSSAVYNLAALRASLTESVADAL